MLTDTARPKLLTIAAREFRGEAVPEGVYLEESRNERSTSEAGLGKKL